MPDERAAAGWRRRSRIKCADPENGNVEVRWWWQYGGSLFALYIAALSYSGKQLLQA